MERDEGGQEVTWRARSASDRTDDWPFWYVTDDNPRDRNKTADAIEAMTGHRTGAVFASMQEAKLLAEFMNGQTTKGGER